MPRVHLILGPVGAGKSTYAQSLVAEHGALFLNLDNWMARLFRPDRPDEGLMGWYVERAARCVDQIWQITLGAVAADTDVVLEIGLIRREQRRAFWRRIDAAGVDMIVHVLDAPRDVRRARVEHRNQARGPTFDMVVPPAIFEMASDMWTPLDVDERAGRDVRDVDTGTSPDRSTDSESV